MQPRPEAVAKSRPDAAVKPNDARTMEAILHTMGVDDFDPRITHQLLELLHRYVSTVLQEARYVAEHADKSSIDADDVKLAIRARSNFTFTQPPPRDVAMRMADERNAVPLPPVDARAGVALPPAVFQLTRQNYRVMIDPARASKRPRMAPGAGSPRRGSGTTATAAGGARGSPPRPGSGSAGSGGGSTPQRGPPRGSPPRGSPPLGSPPRGAPRPVTEIIDIDNPAPAVLPVQALETTTGTAAPGVQSAPSMPSGAPPQSAAVGGQVSSQAPGNTSAAASPPTPTPLHAPIVDLDGPSADPPPPAP